MIVAWFCFCISEKKRKLMLLKLNLQLLLQLRQTPNQNSRYLHVFFVTQLRMSVFGIANTGPKKKGLTRHLPVMYLVYLSMAHLHKKGEWNAKSTVWCRYFQDSSSPFSICSFQKISNKRTGYPGNFSNSPLSSNIIIAYHCHPFILGTWDHHCQ